MRVSVPVMVMKTETRVAFETLRGQYGEYLAGFAAMRMILPPKPTPAPKCGCPFCEE